jgi:NADH:ubiquinone oxidoreductase subunit 2 (subunit N)
MPFFVIFVTLKNKKMYPFVKNFHSGWAYVALLLLVFAVVNSFLGKSSKKEFTAKDRKIALFGLIATHIQLVVALILYFKSPLGSDSIGQMAESDVRLTWLEHPIINILAIVLITIGWSKHKKATTGKAKFNCIFLFYGLGLLLILSRIPWKLWF